MNWPSLTGELLAAPSPSDGGELNSVTVSPGLPGFIVMFVLAVVVVLLLVDMARRVRRVQAKARVEERMRVRREQERAREAEMEVPPTDPDEPLTGSDELPTDPDDSRS